MAEIITPISAMPSRAPSAGTGTMILAWEDICQRAGAVFTASDEVAGFDVENVATKPLHEVWRADTLAGLEVMIDQGDPPTPVRLITINGSNLTAVRNLLLDSHDSSTGNWVKVQLGTIAADTTITDPDGGLSAMKVPENTATSTHRYVQSYTKPSVAGAFYVSTVARDNGRDLTLRSGGANAATDYVEATFDLSAASNGMVTTAGSFADGAAVVTDLGNGWVRCALTGTTDASGTLQVLNYLNNAGSTSYTGDGSSGIHVYSHTMSLGSTTAPAIEPSTGAVNGALILVEAAQTEAGLDSSPPVSELAMYAIEDDLSAHHNHGFRMWLDAPESYRWWRVTIIDDNNADAFVDVGRLGLWNAWRPARNMKAGWSIGYVEPDGDNRRQREVKFDFHYETKADMLGQAMLLDRARGTKRDVVFVADPSEASDAYPHESFVYGTITDMRAVVSDASLLWHKGYTMQEILP